MELKDLMSEADRVEREIKRIHSMELKVLLFHGQRGYA